MTVNVEDWDGAHRSTYKRTVYADEGSSTKLVKVSGSWFYLDAEDGKWVLGSRAYPDNPVKYKRNPSRGKMATRRRTKKRKGGTVKRVGAALTRFLKKQNPAKMRGIKQVRVRKLKNGGVSITPVRTIGNPRRRRNGKVISGYGSTTMNPRRRRKR